MSIVKELSDLCINLRNEARQNKQYDLADKIYLIQDKVKELENENEKLHKQLDIQNKIKYDEDPRSFILDNKDIHYCSVCYGQNGKLIPMSDLGNDKLRCRICEEIWMGKTRI